MLIKDLTKELAAEELSAVQGGLADRGNTVVNTIGQGLELNAPNIVGAGAGSSVNSNNNVDASQYATQTVRQNNGDSLFAIFPFYGIKM
ncbi:MAG TPA: hypothetical protein VFO28_05895 [Burkholderiaceae bacterium]|nr:hypothetical protein [Burkholderiaceae bacterium]